MSVHGVVLSYQAFEGVAMKMVKLSMYTKIMLAYVHARFRFKFRLSDLCLSTKVVDLAERCLRPAEVSETRWPVLQNYLH